ncbi:cellulase family glycosylhydrolase [Actinospica durhamensis]|uniref:Endoglucanase n=2 Tax=Actinospica durhamensis TaxID=1508375 RepID=A0A941EP93_9ACTN|nr:cellulase family glycosylhydrolase [Actinospica durhamensis]
MALAAASTLAPALLSTAAAATAGCSVTYTTSSQWAGGFVANLTLTNTGTTALTSWSLTFTFAGDQKITSEWNAGVTQSGEAVTATSLSYNGAIASGGNTTLGFQGTWTNSDAVPTSFAVNGVSCGAVASTTPSASATSASPSPSASASASKSASPSASASASASKSASPSASPTGTTSSGAAPQLHVSGNKLVDASGNTVLLHGVDRSGTEYECVQGYGIFDGPSDQASITAMKSWGPVNAVRVPLNEACWNGESYVNSAYAGSNYISAIQSYVNLLNANGIVAILDLHWTDGTYTGNSSGCSSAQATCQKPMPDAAEAIPFWTSVANTFKGNNAVVFDLFNEPYASRATGDTTSGWQCWLNGGTCNGISYQVAGMQSMVNAVRSTGASNVLMLGGEEYSNDLTDWLQYEPTDPDGNLVASWHSYNFNTCSSSSCWTSEVAPVIAKVPVIPGEIGENDCGGSYIDSLTSWLESENTGFLAWTWDDWSGGCSSGPTLISDYTGTPTGYGAAFKAILGAL